MTEPPQVRERHQRAQHRHEGVELRRGVPPEQRFGQHEVETLGERRREDVERAGIDPRPGLVGEEHRHRAAGSEADAHPAEHRHLLAQQEGGQDGVNTGAWPMMKLAVPGLRVDSP
nr:hypothetical protein [Streptomyces sp. SCL15-4]